MTEKYKRLLQSSNKVASAATLLCDSPLKDTAPHLEALCSAVDEYHAFLAKEFSR